MIVHNHHNVSLSYYSCANSTRLHNLRELQNPQEYSNSGIMGFEGETQHEITVSGGPDTQRRPPSSEVQWLNESQDPQDLQELKDIADLQRPFAIFFKDISTSSTASTIGDTPGKWIATSDLASILASFAQAEGMMLPSRPSTNVRSPAVKRIPKCAPEHLAAVLPPPSPNTSDLGSFMRLFLNHTRTNSQHWPVSPSLYFSDPATSTAYLYLVNKSAGNGQVGRSHPCERCSWPASDKAALLHSRVERIRRSGHLRCNTERRGLVRLCRTSQSQFSIAAGDPGTNESTEKCTPACYVESDTQRCSKIPARPIAPRRMRA